MLWSEYTLFSTGAGLPPGPGGLLGAAEVRAVVVVVAVVAVGGCVCCVRAGVRARVSARVCAFERLHFSFSSLLHTTNKHNHNPHNKQRR